MTAPLDLAAVKARSAACKVSHECAHQGYGCERCEAEAVTSAADVPALVAEVERLAAEVERRERIIDAERNMQAKLVAEGARLAAENARLRAVRDAAADMLNFGAHHGPCSNDDEDEYGGACLLHVAATKARESALRAALRAAGGG